MRIRGPLAAAGPLRLTRSTSPRPILRVLLGVFLLTAGAVVGCPLPAFPCETPQDCEPGNACVDGVCAQTPALQQDAAVITTGDAGGQGGLDAATDAGRPDASTPDAAPPPDAATPPDAAPAPDAASLPDASAPPDAAPPPDAAVPDAGDPTVDAGTPDAAVDPDAGVDAGPPRCGDIFPLSDNTVPWANTAFAGRTRFTVDTSMFPTGEPIAVALRLNSTTLPACALQNQVVALSQGTPLPLEVDHVEANGDITFWVQVTASGPYQDVDLYWDGTGAAPSGPSPFAGYVVAWHMTGGTFSHPSWNIQRPASVTSVGGFVGQALGFNGTGQVTGASNVDAFNNETAITMSAWVNRNVGDPNQFEGLVHLRAGNNNDFDGEGATLQLTNQRLAAESRAFTWANDFYEPTLFPVNTWTHVAVCFRAGSVVRVYRDGLRVAESRVDQVITNNNDITPTVIGLGHRRFFGANQAFFFGAVDEVRIENAAHGDAWFLADHLGSTGTVVTWQATELLP